MAGETQHIDPLGAAFAMLAKQIADQVAEQNRQAIREAVAEARREAYAEGRSEGLDEPGPASSRKWFTARELEERWGEGFKKSKIYAISPEELPYWQHGSSGRKYFWAHVWAFEGRISQAQAEELYKAHAEVEHALQARKVLLHPAQKLTRVRTST